MQLDKVDDDAFWDNVGKNLQLGKIRLLFVADVIPKTLLSIIEFLNNQMVNTEVLGLEIKQYLSGKKEQIFVPKIVGQTTQGTDIKHYYSKKKTWNREMFLGEVARIGGREQMELADRFMSDFIGVDPKHCRVWYGRGATHPSIVLCIDWKDVTTQFVSVYPWVKGVYLELYFQYFKEPFKSDEGRMLLKRSFDVALDVDIPIEKLKGRPSVDFGLLLDENKYQAFKQNLMDMIEQIKNYEK